MGETMKILLLSPVFPYPPEDGDRIRIFNIIKELKRAGHDIHLVTFIRDSEEGKIKQVKKYVRSLDTVRISRGDIMLNALAGLFSPLPLNVASYKSRKMDAAVLDAVKKHSPDAVFAYRLRMAQYAQGLELPRVIDYVDSLALFMKRSAAYERDFLYLLYYLIDAPRVLKYEKETAGQFSKVFINSEDDRDYLGCANILTAANGARPSGKRGRKKRAGIFTAGFLGNFAYRPNFEAAVFLIKKVWKKVIDNDKNIRLIIAGKGSGRLGEKNSGGIVFKDFVPDVAGELFHWDISVIPVRYGAGRQNKLMDCWACNVPVVADPFAASGVYGRDGVNLLIASTPDEFTEKIMKLKDNPGLAKKIAAGGAATLEKYFSWAATGRIMGLSLIKAVKNNRKR
jgi:glycosyltransferase involved in cell wall biosynthesis